MSRLRVSMCRLGEVAEFLGGGTPSRAEQKYFGGGIPWVKTTDLNNGYVSATEETLTDLGLKESSCKTVPAKSVLVAMYGGFNQIGRTGLLQQASAINQALTAIIPNPARLAPEFLLEWLNFRKSYWKRFAGSSRKDPNITKGDVADFPVPIVSVDLQIDAVRVLQTWNDAIQRTERLIGAKQRHFAATSHCLLTARLRLRGITVRWELRRADEMFENTSHKGHTSEPLLSVTQEYGVIPRGMLEGRVTMPSGDTGSFKLVEPSNFVISLRSFQGGLEHSNYRGVVSPAYTVLKATVVIDERFFRHYFKSADFIKRLSVAVIGIRDGKQISFQDFCSIKLPFPPFDEQKAIAAILDEAEREIMLLRKYRDTLKRQKRGLMQKLLTGQWRLPLAAQEAV
jgi:type I restriction enzyme, S subunit